MSDIAINFDYLFYGGAISLVVLLIATPLAWRVLRPVPRVTGAITGALACTGLAGLAALPFSLSELRLEGTALAVLIFSAALQGVAAIILMLLPRRA